MNNVPVLGDGFIPRMSRRSRPGIMQALRPPDLFGQDPASIPSVIVDARLALVDKDVTAELSDRHVAMIVDTQAWRYSDSRTSSTPWGSLVYAPSIPFNLHRSWVNEYVLADLSAQESCGCGCLMLPGWFPSLESVELALDVGTWILRAYESFRRGSDGVPVIAWLPATSGSLATSLALAKVYVESGLVDVLYVQRDKTNGVRDPVDRLRHSAKLMLAVQSLGLPVIAGHLGSVGLTLRALGIAAADSGPAEGLSFDFTDAIRRAVPPIPQGAPVKQRPSAVRLWIDEVGQTVTTRQMTAIRADRVAFAEILCRRPCHRFRISPDTMSVAVHHSLLSLCESATLQSRLPISMRVDNAQRLLTAMKRRATMMDSALLSGSQPLLRQEHLDVQLALLAEV
jgi:hypothetical protein